MSSLSSGLLRTLGRRELDPENPADALLDELYSSLALLILVTLLIGTLWTSYYLQLKKIRAVHETVVSIFGGMIVGLIIRLSPRTAIQNMVSFKYSVFFNLLLPPIILNSGYELHQANFFRNIWSILTYAFGGTFISAVVVGVIVWLWTKIGLESLPLSFRVALQLGATLSATDPVTVIAIFHTYKVDPKLFTIIFGESLLNDAVAIVMFQALGRNSTSDEKVGVVNMFKSFGIFLSVFSISLIIGVVVGLAMALMLKHSRLRMFPQIEICLITLMAYGSYFFSNALKMSGIVSLLFCGITTKHYAYHNMSQKTRIGTKHIFQVLAQLSENFIFIYLGLSLFTMTELVFKPTIIVITTLAICVARWCAVFPTSYLINIVSRHRQRSQGVEPDEDQIPKSYQVMLFWAGLRGAVGVALAAGLNDASSSSTLKATVLIVVVLTVIIFGGTTARMLEILGIRTNVASDDYESDDDDYYESQNELERSWRAVRRTNGSVDSSRPIPLETTAAVNRAGRPYPIKNKNGTSDRSQPEIPDPFSVSDEENSDNESTASDLPPRANSQVSPHRNSPNRSNTGTPTGSRLGRVGNILGSTLDDRAKWFLEFDQNVLKPVLLQGNNNGESKDREGR